MTVTVTNDDGQPQAGASLTRDYAYSRGAVDGQYIKPCVIGEPVPLYNFAWQYDADAGCTCNGSGV